MSETNKLKDLVKGLINDSTTTEQVEQIGGIVQEIDNMEKEYTDLLNKHEELRKKYIAAVKDSTFKEKPKDEEQKPLSLEECISEEIEKRKD